MKDDRDENRYDTMMEGIQNYTHNLRHQHRGHIRHITIGIDANTTAMPNNTGSTGPTTMPPLTSHNGRSRQRLQDIMDIYDLRATQTWNDSQRLARGEFTKTIYGGTDSPSIPSRKRSKLQKVWSQRRCLMGWKLIQTAT